MASFQNSHLWIFKWMFSIWLTNITTSSTWSSNTNMAISLSTFYLTTQIPHLPVSRKPNISFLRFPFPRIASEPWGLPPGGEADRALILTTSCSVTCRPNATEDVPPSPPQQLSPDLGPAFAVPCSWTPMFMHFIFYQNLHTGSPWSHSALLTHCLG